MGTIKLINGFPHLPYSRISYTQKEMLKKSSDYLNWMDQRRTVRDISNRPVAKAVIDHLLLTASTAPSGAHKQPWTFCAVSNPELKSRIRQAAEEEEYKSYHGRMSKEWLNDLKSIGTDWHKPFLEQAPWIIVVFKKVYDFTGDKKSNHYYVNESVGIACGFLLTAIHQAGLVALTHTPSPMNFLSQVLDRPENERPFLVIPVGYPEAAAYVPDLKRKPLEEVAVYYE
ncbi:MAG: oxidoreductase [Cyclobacteriaceae bacterium]|nr:MAG: oxidoreductase [Cyclobacteriaceae bacterium]